MNEFSQLLRAAGGRPPIGTWVLSASPLVAEAVGCAGFDWGVLDMEHAPVDMAALVHLLQAVGNTKMVPVVRVPWNDAVTVKRVLDAGAMTVLFPFVQTESEARMAVASTRYPPAGVRGMVDISRASRFGTAADHFRGANARVGVVLQLETPQALAHLEPIATVPGVDALFIGPADLSAVMGHVGEPMHPEVMAAMSDAAARARAVGRPIGTIGNTPEAVTRYRAAGFDFVAISSDLGLLMSGAQAAVRALRTGDVQSHVHTLAEGTRTEGAV